MELFTYLMAKNDHNTSVKKDLFSYLLGKNQSGTYTDYSGTSLSINNTKKGKMKVNLLGNTSQTGTPTPSTPIDVNVVSGDNTIVSTGKNLFDKNNETYTTGYITGSSATSLSPSSYNRTLYIHCQPNTTYTIQKMVSASSSRFFIASSVDIPSAGVSIYNVLNGGDNNTSATYTTSNNAKYLLVNYMATNTTTTTVEEMLNSIQIEVGNQATTYEPYTSTSYPIHLGEYELCKISTYQDRFIKTTGKNLFDKNGNLALDYRLTTTGTNYSASDYYISEYIPINSNTTYTKNSPTADAFHRVCFYTSNDVSTFVSYLETNTFTTPSNAKYLRFCGLQTEIDTAQLELGSTATSYEPYGTNEWYLEKKTNSKIFDGTEEYNQYSTTNKFFTNVDDALYSSNIYILCNKYLGQVSGSGGDNKGNYTCWLQSEATYKRLYFRNDSCADADEFTTFMTNNNATVYYPLVSPTYTQITGALKDELEALQKAQSYKGTTNINQINNDLPFNMDVSVKVGS